MKNFRRFSAIFFLVMVFALMITSATAIFASAAEAESTSTIGTDKWAPHMLEALKFMGLGMIGIFVVTGIIIIVIYALNHFTNMEKKKDNNEEQ